MAWIKRLFYAIWPTLAFTVLVLGYFLWLVFKPYDAALALLCAVVGIFSGTAVVVALQCALYPVIKDRWDRYGKG